MSREKSRPALKLVMIVIVVASAAFLREQRHLIYVPGRNFEPTLSYNLSTVERYARIPRFRILVGIFSMDSGNEAARRSLIKNTYLSFPKFMHRYNVTTVPLRFTTVCSLDDYWRGNTTFRDECQILYTFVIGAATRTDPNASKEYIDLEEGRSMTVKPSKLRNNEADTTYLNIIENMNEGKTPTWFKYASSQIPQELEIDLIAKVDSDCVVYPVELISQIDRIREEMEISYPLHNIYGGSRQMGTDRSYMQGGFYFMSQDIASWITSDKCDRKGIINDYKPAYKDERAEDVEMSRFILSYPNNVHEIEIPRAAAYAHDGRMKLPSNFRDNWKWYIATYVARDRIRKVQLRTNMTCPSDEDLDEERAELGEELVRMVKRFDLLRKQLRSKCESSDPS